VKICLVTAFPPSRGGLNEYGFHVAKALKELPQLDLTILSDELPTPQPELEGFNVIRCWSFNSLSNPARLVAAIRRCQPDIVWFNLGFASFGSKPVPAFAGIVIPPLLRGLGYYTHVTLHQIMDTMDLGDARVPYPRLYRLGGWVATRLLLMSNSLSVLIPAYRRTLIDKYHGENVHFRPHGILFGRPVVPDLSKHSNPTRRILAFGKWGTYKRLEPLIEAFEKVSAREKNVRLVVAGGNHPETPGYVESMAQRYADREDMEFRGYVAEDDIPELFRSANMTVLAYSSSAGSSGVAHLACEYGLPIVAADLPEFRDMATAEGLAVCFYEARNTDRLADALISLLSHPEWQQQMAERNFNAALRMTMPAVIRQYLRLFELHHSTPALTSMIRARRVPRWVPFRSFWTSYLSRKAALSWQYNTPSEDRAATTGDPSSETMARAAVGSDTL
jgi:glycosyltransferase involved in cell wall biosynthesis